MNELVVRYEVSAGACVPSYETDGAAGADLRAFIHNEMSIEPGRRALVPTGVRMEIPIGYEAQIRPRSGLALKHGITCLNSPGTIDSDYRGEVMVILVNHGEETFKIHNGDRIAQMVFAPISRAIWSEQGDLQETPRSHDGFGSTGL